MVESQPSWQPDRGADLPIYFQIETYFEQQIFDQHLNPHDTLPSIPELVKAWNVSPLTVHKAFRRLKERGLIYSIVGSGTFVSPVDKQSYVGVLIHRELLAQATNSPTVLLYLQAIHEQLAAAGYQDRLIVDYHPRQYGRRAPLSPDAMTVIEQSSLQGLVGIGHNGSDELFDLLKSRNVPSVSWHQCHQGFDVTAELATEDFIAESLQQMQQRGVTDVAMIWLDAPNETQANRVASLRDWEQLFQAADIPFQTDWIVGVSSLDATVGGDAFEYLWDQSTRPRGLIITDDVIGRSVLMSTMASRVRVPDELCITTMINRGSPIVFPLSWSQWEHDPHDTARMAVNAITRMNRGETVADTIAMTLRQTSASARDQARITPGQQSFTIAREILEAAS